MFFFEQPKKRFAYGVKWNYSTCIYHGHSEKQIVYEKQKIRKSKEQAISWVEKKQPFLHGLIHSQWSTIAKHRTAFLIIAFSKWFMVDKSGAISIFHLRSIYCWLSEISTTWFQENTSQFMGHLPYQLVSLDDCDQRNSGPSNWFRFPAISMHHFRCVFLGVSQVPGFLSTVGWSDSTTWFFRISKIP